jgi:hypothetical protein
MEPHLKIKDFDVEIETYKRTRLLAVSMYGSCFESSKFAFISGKCWFILTIPRNSIISIISSVDRGIKKCNLT